MPKPRIKKPRPPKPPRERKPRTRRASDHRALVLEVVATAPYSATRDAIQDEVAKLSQPHDFGPLLISAMVSSLLAGGLLGRKEDGTLFITQHGLDYLKHAAFDRKLPEPGIERPGRWGKKHPRKPRQT